MAKRSDTDKAIRNIMNWSNRPEWMEQQSEVFEAHLRPVCQRFDIGPEELDEELEKHGYNNMLFGVIFEDFLSQHASPDDKNIIDDYLQRRGWRESVSGRRYLQQLRNSVLSLYEVVDVSPGHHCDLRDLLRKGPTIRVHEQMGTQSLIKWDHLAARVLDKNGQHIFAGGILPFPQEASQTLRQVLTESQPQFNEKRPQPVSKQTADEVLSPENTNALFLQDSGPAFTSIWLSHALEHLRAPQTEMINHEGETLLFIKTRFPFLAEQLDEIAQHLDSATNWERDAPGENIWIWFPKPVKQDTDVQQGIMLDTLQDGQRSISGILKLTAGVLMLSTNSKGRAERGQKELEELLHGLIGPALSELQTPEQLMAEDQAHLTDEDENQPTDILDPEIAEEIMRDYFDQHYRQCLDDPIPMLDNKTPRQCAKNKKRRQKVIEWLKQLENNEIRRASSQGQVPYDSRWMWDELKLAKYR